MYSSRYALARNRRFCPAAPMKKAPTTVLDPLHHCWGPNWHKTTAKKIQWCCLMLGTLADDLRCPVQPPSLVLVGRSRSPDPRPHLRLIIPTDSGCHLFSDIFSSYFGYLLLGYVSQFFRICLFRISFFRIKNHSFFGYVNSSF